MRPNSNEGEGAADGGGGGGAGDALEGGARGGGGGGRPRRSVEAMTRVKQTLSDGTKRERKTHTPQTHTRRADGRPKGTHILNILGLFYPVIGLFS
jgi:hypothetical protein